MRYHRISMLIEKLINERKSSMDELVEKNIIIGIFIYNLTRIGPDKP